MKINKKFVTGISAAMMATGVFFGNVYAQESSGASIGFFNNFGRTLGDQVIRTGCKLILQPILQIIQARGWLDPDLWSVMSEYCENLNDLAKKGKIHDAIGRDKEINELIDVLTRQGKGNPCIIGDAGVGKTALVEGLAYRISKGNVPDAFKNKKIIRVNMVSLIAGKAYNGGSGAVGRIRALFSKAAQDPNIILFIDEFHQIAKCGAADLCKTYLDHGDIKIIAATTVTEYRRDVAKDPALDRRFTCMQLSELNKAQTFEVIKSLRTRFEQDEVVLPDDAILAAIKFTDMYMKNRTYPDKAIDVVDSACRAVVRKSKVLSDGEAVKDPKIEVKPIVTIADIKAVVASQTNIPIGEVSSLEADLLNSLESRLGERVKGQDEAIKAVSDAVRRGRAGVGKSSSKPEASFLFTGCSGVGKTTLAKALGDEIGNIVEVDLSQFVSSKEFTEKIWKKPRSVLLFEGIEHADANTLNMILGILENGYILNSSGYKVDFSNTTIVITSSIGESTILNSADDSEYSKIKSEVVCELEKKLGNRFVNRIGEVVVFNKLNKQSFRDITKLFIEALEYSLSSENINLKIEDEVIDAISDVEIRHSVGAHQIPRIISNAIEKEFSRLIIQGKIGPDKKVICTMKNNRLVFDVQ